MLSVEKIKEILGEDAQDMTDDQVQDFINLLYSLCNITWNKNSGNGS